MSTAKAPATCGVAIEVPLRVPKAPPGTAAKMLLPGASRSTSVAWLEKPETVSALVVLPTVTAVEMQPGALTSPSTPSLPDGDRRGDLGGREGCR